MRNHQSGYKLPKWKVEMKPKQLLQGIIQGESYQATMTTVSTPLSNIKDEKYRLS